MKLWTIMQRNLKLLLRSKTSALVVILGPLFIIFLVGLAFNTSNLYSINVGVFDPAQTSLSESFTDQMFAANFQVRHYTSEEKCIESVRWAESHVCMVFPPDFYLENNKTNNIVFHADTSKVNLVYMVLDTVSSQISSQTVALSSGMTEVILSAIENTRMVLAKDADLLSQQAANRKNILARTDAASDTLDALNLNAPDSELDDLEDSTGEFGDLVDTMDDVADDALVELDVLIRNIDSELEDIIDQLDDANVSASHADAITDLLNSSEDKLNTLREDLTASSSNASERIDNLDDLINDVGKDFSELTYLLDKAKVARGQIKKDLDAIDGYLAQSKVLATQILSAHSELMTSFDSIEITSAESIVRPITTSIQPVSTEKSNLSYLYPSLIMLILMFISIMLPATLVIMERKSLATFRNFCTPTKIMSFFLGTYFASLVVVLLQMGIILGISAAVFNAYVDIVALSVVIITMSTLFILLGMSIGYIFSSQETVMLASISMASLFLFVSDLIMPLESMPSHIAQMAAFNPFILGAGMLKQIILFASPLFALWNQLYLVLIYAGSIFLLTYLAIMMMKAKFLRLNTQFHGKRTPVRMEASETLVLGPKTIKNLGELAESIEAMDDKTFKAYLDDNVFAKWIRSAYHDDELAIKLTEAKKRLKHVKLLKKAHKSRDRMIKNAEKTKK